MLNFSNVSFVATFDKMFRIIKIVSRSNVACLLQVKINKSNGWRWFCLVAEAQKHLPTKRNYLRFPVLYCLCRCDETFPKIRTRDANTFPHQRPSPHKISKP